MAIVCTTLSGHDFRHYPTTLEYLQDIDVGLTRFYKDVLANQEELDKDGRIPQSLQNAPPIRDLVMNTDVDFTSDKWISNMIGLFVFVSGVERTTSAASCDKGVVSNSRRFGDQTVVADNAYKADLKQNYRKACSCCMFNSNMTRCNLYRKRAQ